METVQATVSKVVKGIRNCTNYSFKSSKRNWKCRNYSFKSDERNWKLYKLQFQKW